MKKFFFKVVKFLTAELYSCSSYLRRTDKNHTLQILQLRMSRVKKGQKQGREEEENSSEEEEEEEDEEQEEDEEEEEEPKKKTTGVVCPDFVDKQVWDDWMIVRKDKKANTLTETAWTRFVNQVEKAGWTLEQAISHCCLKNWVSFEADWVAPKQSFVKPADVIHMTTPTPPNQDAALRKIEEDSKKAVPIPANIREKMAALLGDKNDKSRSTQNP